MSIIKFQNHDSKKTIEVIVSKPLTFIYGGNGTGKTTLSRSFKLDDAHVFNIDFVNRNVCIINPEGATTDAKTKENFSQLFLGEESNALSLIISNLKKAKKGAEESYANLNLNINNYINANQLPRFNILELSKVLNSEYSFTRDNLDRMQNYNGFKLLNSLTTTINSDGEFTSLLIKYKNETITNDILAKINLENSMGGILKLTLLDKNFSFIEAINQAIVHINSNMDDIIKLEGIYKLGDKDPRDVEAWVKKGLSLHTNMDNCFFCKSNDITDQKEKWISSIESKLATMKSDLIGKLETMQKSFNILLANDDLYMKVYPKMIQCLKLNYKRTNDCITQIKKNEKISSLELASDVDIVVTQQNQLGINLLNYYLNKSLKELLFSYIFLNEINKSIDSTTIEINKLNEKFAIELSANINSIQEQLGFKKKIKIMLDNKGITPKINLATSQGKLSDLSEGQRHKLALAVFFAKILKDKKKDKDIVLDDPVISLDVKAYHYLKSFLFEIGKDRKSSRLIILSHNIHYLFIQLSNIFDSADMSKLVTLYELTSDSISEVDLNILRYDDLLLFRKVINSIVDIEDISIVHWMIPKIFRYYLDIKLRMQGIETLDNPALGIEKLNCVADLREELLKINRIINAEHKKQIIDTNSFFKSLELLNRALEIFQFPLLVIEKTIDLKKTLSGKKTIDKPNPKNALHAIVNYGRKIVFCNAGDKKIELMADYINHPRHQLTESLMAIKLEKDE